MNDDLDKLKYRNEIEVMSRLRNYKVNDLYNESTNTDVSNKINELYPPQDLYVYNDNPTVNDVVSHSISWDSYLKVTLDSYDRVEDKVAFLLSVIQLCTSLLKSLWV